MEILIHYASLVHLFLRSFAYIGYFWLSYADTSGCNSRLLADLDGIPDSAFEHSSAVNSRHGAAAARNIPDNADLQERAWCPNAMIHTELREFMQIDLKRQNVVKLIITKGRVSQNKGRQTTPFFHVKYRREKSGVWFEYQKENGTRRLTGNRDAMTENYNTMEPPFVARYIRIYPYSLNPMQTCLKIELLGCNAHGVVEYQALQGSLISKNHFPDAVCGSVGHSQEERLQDRGYDFRPSAAMLFSPIGQTQNSANYHRSVGGHAVNNLGHMRQDESSILRGGLGKLTDNETELLENTSPINSCKYLGWNRSAIRQQNVLTKHDPIESVQLDFVRILFRFDNVYSFSAVRIFAATDQQRQLGVIKNISVQFMLDYPVNNENMHKNYMFWLHGNSFRRNGRSSGWIEVNLRLNSEEAGKTVNADATDQIQSQQSTQINRYGRDISNTLTATDATINKLGRFAEIRLYFDSDWIFVGEINFENEKMENFKFPAKQIQTSIRDISENAGTQTDPDVSSNEIETTVAQAGSNSITFTLTIVCSLLAALICVILMFFACFHRRMCSHLSPFTSIRRRRKYANGSAHFECFSDRTQNVNLASYPGGILDSCKLVVVSQDSKTGTNLCYTKRNSEYPAGDLGSNKAYLDKNIASNSVPFSITLPVSRTQTLLPGRNQQQTNENYSRHTTGFLLTGAGNGGIASIATSGLQSPEMLPFYCARTSNVNFDPNASTDPTMGDMRHRKLIADSAIYTSLPGSDCESQPYAPVGTESAIMQQFSPYSPKYHPFPNHHLSNGEGFLGVLPTANLPPPPSLPLPPPPQSFPQITNGNGNLMHLTAPSSNIANHNFPTSDYPKGQIDNLNVPAPEYRSVQMDQSNWRGNNTPLFRNRFPTLSLLQAAQHSDYSNATLGSSSNAYGSYYTSTIFTKTRENLNTHHRLQPNS